MMRWLVLLSILGGMLFPIQVYATGVDLADGDSFRIGRQRYRLYGIDAPELHQECKDVDGRAWPCGTRARTELRRIIATHPLECRSIEIDRFGRIVATCLAGNRDIAEEMVLAGYATASGRRGASSPYEDAQRQARAAKRGLWAGTFETPREWRRSNPRTDVPERPVITPRAWLDQKIASIRQFLAEWFPWLFDR
jgi:endonuclease YncB( thermonuclease family)